VSICKVYVYGYASCCPAYSAKENSINPIEFNSMQYRLDTEIVNYRIDPE
jgi:hypothetical protein